MSLRSEVRQSEFGNLVLSLHMHEFQQILLNFPWFSHLINKDGACIVKENCHTCKAFKTINVIVSDQKC